MTDDFARSVEQLRADHAQLPALLDDAVNGVAMFARGVSDLVQALDSRRAELARCAPLGDAVPPLDADRARLVAAARRGPADAAAALGKAARQPASLALPETDPAYSGAGIGDASRAAAALLTWRHHRMADVNVRQVLEDADPVEVALMLAMVAVDLAEGTVPDVDAWITTMGAAWALDGD